MEAIGYADKDNTLPTSDVRRLWRAADANEIKAKYNATIAEIPGLISTAVDALITGAPGALDTLNELAAALGDDANFAATMATALAGKASTGYVDAKVANDLTASTTVAPSKTAVNTGLALRLLIANIVFNEVPTGTIDAANDTFTIANAVLSELIMVFADGSCVNPANFELTGTNLVLSVPPDNSLTVTYIKA